MSNVNVKIPNQDLDANVVGINIRTHNKRKRHYAVCKFYFILFYFILFYFILFYFIFKILSFFNFFI